MTTMTKSLPMVVAPSDGDFEGDYAQASELQEWVDYLLSKHARFGFLRAYRVEIVWKRKGGGKDNPKLGKCVKPQGLVKHYSGADFVIWLAADHIRARQETGEWSAEDTEATVFHELLHCGEDEETGKLKIVGHDYEGFISEIEEHGFRTPALQQVRDAVQLRMGWR